MSEPKIKKPKLILSENDEKLFKMLWKWKGLTTSAISKKYFPRANVEYAYRRLLNLYRYKYVDIEILNKGTYSVNWILAHKGFQFVRSRIQNIEEDGYLSENPWHDHLVTAFHLGEWLTNKPRSGKVCTEQELRRISPDNWPDFIPKSLEHRPDGYSICFKDAKSCVVAFEVETSLKASSRYDKIVEFYDTEDKINLVFWLIDSLRALQSIEAAFRKHGIVKWNKHHFVLLEEFKAQGWDAKFVSGEFKGKTPADFLLPQGRPTNSLETPHRDFKSLLDVRKKPLNSYTYKKSENPKIAD